MHRTLGKQAYFPKCQSVPLQLNSFELAHTNYKKFDSVISLQTHCPHYSGSGFFKVGHCGSQTKSRQMFPPLPPPSPYHLLPSLLCLKPYLINLYVNVFSIVRVFPVFEMCGTTRYEGRLQLRLAKLLYLSLSLKLSWCTSLAIVC